MKIDHIHFFVEDAAHQRDWFVQRLGWTWVKRATLPDRNLEILRYRNTLFLLSSPRQPESPVAEYLRHHAPGVADVALEVNDLSAVLHRLNRLGRPTPGRPMAPNPRRSPGSILAQLDNRPATAWACIPGWGSLRHTLIQRPILNRRQPTKNSLPAPAGAPASASAGGPAGVPNGGPAGAPDGFPNGAPSGVSDGGPPASQGIDHMVLNVPTGELQAAASFYQRLFDLQQKQQFNIQTDQSGLRSQVLFSPASQLYFNINEPAHGTAAPSQIQAFLNANRGAGIQHIALPSEPLVPTVMALRRRGVPLLSVPATYYGHMQRRLRSQPVPPVLPQEWQQIVEQQILLDWHPNQPQSLLLQIFSQPIFPNNHFFFEFIERRQAVQGFGAGNFLALYQAIEAMEKGRVATDPVGTKTTL